jgi:fused signal recognition particle receptor
MTRIFEMAENEKKGFFSRLKSGLTGEKKLEETQQKLETPTEEKKGFFSRLKEGLNKTRANLTAGLAKIGLGKRKVDEELLEEIETLLLLADVGVEATKAIMADLQKRAAKSQLNDSEALFKALSEDMTAILQPVTQPLVIPKNLEKPFVLLMVGMNGAGKTTTIGKLAKRFQNEGYSVMLAAGDTFRAAAVEQLKAWGERNNVPVIAQQSGSDSASVIYDAVNAATARNIDILIADTAGRLHTQGNLMAELAKVKKVISKLDPDAPHEVMLIIDASIGQNALNQVKEFHQMIGLTGLSITKLDGTAKGGIVFAIAKRIGLPIRFIGMGEKIDDLRVFDAEQFVSALLSREENETT